MTNNNLIFDFESGTLRISVIGSIDHSNAAKMRDDIDAKILELSPRKVILDLSQLNSIDASGLGLVIGRYQLLREFKAKLVIENPNTDVLKLLKLSGVNKIIKIMKSK